MYVLYSIRHDRSGPVIDIAVEELEGPHFDHTQRLFFVEELGTYETLEEARACAAVISAFENIPLAGWSL